MFRSYSDHLQGAHMFRHIFTQKTRTHTKCYAVATPYFYIYIIFLKNFKISNFNKEHMSSLKMM